VFADEARVRDAIARCGGDVTIAAVNSPSQLTISGTRDPMRTIVAALQADGVKTRTIAASHAFHSSLMEPMLDEYERLASDLRYTEPTTAFVSNVTGRFVEPGEITNAPYWRRHVRETVRFAEGLQALYDRGYRLFVEIGPNSTLASMGRNALGATDALWLPSIKQGRDWDQMLETAGTLYVRGAHVDWEGFDRAYGRQRVALPTSPFRRRRFWFEDSATPARPKTAVHDASRWMTVAAAGRQQAGMVPLDLDLPTYAARWDVLDRLSTAFIVSAFRELGLFAAAGESLTVAEIMARGGIAETYHHLLGRWCRKLASQGLLREQGDRFVADTPLQDPAVQSLVVEARATLADTPFLTDYLERCGRLMTAVLTGRESALETLFPGGSFETAERIYHHWAYSRYFGGIGRAVMDAAARTLNGRDVRVIEVGAGTGGLTASLLPALPEDRTTYFYTDVSEFFFSQAKQRFAAYPFVRYGVLDLEKSPESQGYGAHGFDIVVAANVLHATRRLDETLARVRSLLAPGGMLLLYEVTNPPAWFDVSIALIEGWQLFDDGLRGDGPLLPREQWEEALRAAGFDACDAFPQPGSPAEILGAHIMVARTPASAVTIREPGRLADVEPSRPSQAAPRSEGQDAADLVATLMQLPPLERQEQLAARVRDHVMFVLRRDASDGIGRRDRLMDLGIDSLMAVELRDRLTSGFALPRRLPATLIFDCPTVDAIAALIGTMLPIAEQSAAIAPVVPVSADNAPPPGEEPSDDQIADLLLRKLESL
jgi:malonyl CoA-acyl carrier protein transacylase/acyl carrier protein